MGRTCGTYVVWDLCIESCGRPTCSIETAWKAWTVVGSIILKLFLNKFDVGSRIIFSFPFFAWRKSPPPPPQWARVFSLSGFHDHTQRHTTVVRTPLDEWSARRKDPNLTTHKTRKRVRHPCRRGGIRTRNLNGLTATDPRLRSHGHSDVRLAYFYENVDQISADIKRR